MSLDQVGACAALASASATAAASSDSTREQGEAARIAAREVMENAGGQRPDRLTSHLRGQRDAANRSEVRAAEVVCPRDRNHREDSADSGSEQHGGDVAEQGPVDVAHGDCAERHERRAHRESRTSLHAVAEKAEHDARQHTCQGERTHDGRGHRRGDSPLDQVRRLVQAHPCLHRKDEQGIEHHQPERGGAKCLPSGEIDFPFSRGTQGCGRAARIGRCAVGPQADVFRSAHEKEPLRENAENDRDDRQRDPPGSPSLDRDRRGDDEGEDGQSAPGRHDDQRHCPGAAAHEPLRDRRGGADLEWRGEHQPRDSERDVEPEQSLCAGEREAARAHGDGGPDQQRPRSVAVEQRSDERRDERAEHRAERHRPGNSGTRPTELGGHRHDEDRERRHRRCLAHDARAHRAADHDPTVEEGQALGEGPDHWIGLDPEVRGTMPSCRSPAPGRFSGDRPRRRPPRGSRERSTSRSRGRCSLRFLQSARLRDSWAAPFAVVLRGSVRSPEQLPNQAEAIARRTRRRSDQSFGQVRYVFGLWAESRFRTRSHPR